MSQTVEVRLNFTAETAQAEQALNRLQTSLRNISTQSNMDTGGFRFTQELNSASDAAIKLRQNLSNAINTNTNKLDLSKFRKEMDKSGMSLEKYRVALQQIGPEGQNAFVDLSKAILASQTPLTRSLGLFDKLWDTLKRTAGWQISSNIMHGFQSALSDAYDYAQDLNRSLNDIRIVTGYGADRMADFAKQANKAAKELSATTLDYTDASLIYYQQGLDDKAVKERTDTTIKMANVTGTTAQTVSQQMTAVWENFMKNGEHATEYYADVMTALGAATASSTDEIADGLEKFAAVADTVGLSYEYATSALTTITAKTRQSADVVGTALKTIFARIEGLNLGKTLEDGTTLNKYSTALEAVGVNIKDDTGNLKDMDDILDEIGSKWETLSKDQQVALAQTVAGVRQYTQFIALMDNWDFMGENLATAYGAEGTLEEQQKIYEDSWKAARNRLQASMETLYDDLLKDDFFIWLTDALSDVVGLIDKIADSMGGLAGVLPGLILLMNKLWGDKIISGISTVAYNIGGLVPSINSKRQEADLALKNKTMAEWKIMQDEYQGNLNNSASKASYQAYSQISKIEETRLRLGKGITEQQTAILDTYREQLELLEKMAKTQGQQVDATRKERVEAEAYISLLQDQTEQQIRSRSTAKYRAGAGSAWLNAVGANYKKGMDISSIPLPQERGAAAKGILKYLNESTSRQINWEDVQAYSSGNTANENYDAIASAIERLRDRSDEAEQSVARLNEILKFSPSSNENSGELQKQAELIGTIEGIAPQLENIKTRMSNIGVGEESGENIAKLTSCFRELLETVGYSEDELEAFDDAIDNNKTDIALLTETLGKYLTNSSDSASITNKLTAAEKDLNNTLSELVTKYNIAPEAVTRLRNALQNYARTATNAEGVTEALKNAIKSTNAGLSQMGQSVDKIQRIQNITTAVTSLAMGISSLKSAIDTINNPDLSGLEKFTSVAMSVSIAVSSLMGTLKGMQEIVSLVSGAISLLSAKIIINKVIQDSANASTWASIPALKSKEMAILAVQIATEKLTVEEGAKKIAELAGIPIDAATTIAERILAEGRDKLTAKTIILAAVEAIKNGVFLKSLATILALIRPYILLAAALGGVAFIIAKVIQAYQNQETVQEKAARQANEAARATENAKKAYEELCNTIDSYESGVDKLKDLEEGTLEFKQALIDTNERALELINKLNLIYGKDWKYDDQGKIVFLDENGNVDEGFTEREKEKQADKVLSTQQMATHYNNAARGVEADEYFNNYDYSVDKNIGLSTTTKGKTTIVHDDGKKYAWDYMADSGLSMTELLGMAQGLNFATGDDTMSDEQVKQFYQMLEDRGITDKDKQRAIRRAVEDVNASDDSTERATEIDKQLENKRVGNAEKDNYYDSKAKELADTWGQVLDLDETATEQAKELANIDTAVKKSEAAKKYDNYTDDALLNEYYKNTGIANSDEFKENYKIEDGKLKKKNENGDWEEASEDDQYYISTETAKDSLKADAVYPEVKEDVVDSLITSYLQKNGIEVTEGGTDRMTKAVENLVTTSDDSLLDEETLTNEDIIKIQNENEDLRLTEEEIRKLHDARLKYNEMTYEGLEDEQQSLAETASNYSSCSDEVTELKDAVKKYGKESKTAQNAQKKLNQALKNAQWTKFAKNIASAIKELKNLDKNGDDYKDKCQEIADAWNDIFDPDITADFVADNEELFTDWMNSSGEEAGRLATKIALKATEAADTVNSAFTKALEWKGQGDAPTGFEKKINNMQELYAATEAFLEANPLEIDAEGRANLTPLLNALMGAGASAEQVAKILAAIGQTEVEIDGQLISTADISKAKGSFEDYLKSGGFEVENFQLQAEGKGSVPDVNPSSIMTNAGTGGGGGGGSKKDKKKASDEIERYHVVKQQLDRLSSEYDQLSAAKDRAYGPDKLKAIDKEIAKLQEQEAMQKRYLNEIERYYQQDRAAIAKYGAVFDANGIITNYDALMQKQLDIFNASLTDEAEEAYNAFKETLDQYEETLALKLEESGNLLDKQYEIVSAKLEKITYKVEYKIEIEDDKLDYLERRLTRLSEVEKASLQVFAINQDKIMSYWIQYATYAEAIKDIEAEINAQKAKGLEITDEQIQKLQDYKNSMGEIEDNIYDLYNDEIDSISDRYSNLFDQLENYQDRIRDYRDSLETIKDMYSLLGVATVEDNRAMNDSIRKTYQAEAKGIQNEIDLLKARREELDKSRNSLGKSVDEQGHLIDGIVADIKQLEDVGDLTIMEDSTKAYSQKLQDQIDEIDQQVHEKQMKLISLASDYLNAIKDQWIDNLELIGQKTKDALYEGLEWAIDKYGDLTDLSELYLSNTRKIYELNKLNRSIQADINKVDSVVAKNKLRDLMKDINGYYADNVKMSEYELKNLQAQYELRLAEIALEDARNAKSEVRLTRDNEGRWGYMYTANTEEVDKAEQELEDKQYALQQLQEDTLKDAGEKILSLQNDYIDAMTELQSSDLSDEQKKKRAEELTSLYQNQLDYYYKTYAQALEASGLAYEETILGQATNTKSLQEVMETFGHASIEMTDQMINETQKYQEAFIQMVSDITGKQINSYEEAQKAWMDYMGNMQKALNEATTKATDNFNKVAEAIRNMSEEFKKMIEELMVYLARLSGEDMSLLFYSALANGDYEMAERYAKARRQKIDSNPDEYGQYDWDTDKMNQIIDEKQNKDTPMSQEQREALLATAKEPYSAKTDWSLAMRNALSAGEYDKAGQYAEYRAYKVHNDASLKDLAWTEAQLQAEIDQYAQDVSKMSPEQKRRILATASQYDTGGYTGSWGNEGRWALLHEKELVLNKNDTSNLLTTVTLLHDLMARLDQASAWSALRELTPASATTTTEILEQNVHIEASFPNAVDHNEIEQAFENIVNLASQYANRK